MNLAGSQDKMIVHQASQYATNERDLSKFYIAGVEWLANADDKYTDNFDKLTRFASWHIQQSIVEIHAKPKSDMQIAIDKVNLIFKHPIEELIFEPINLPMVSRIEVIDDKGRSYVNWETENKVSLNFQDDGKTLKVIIKEEI